VSGRRVQGPDDGGRPSAAYPLPKPCPTPLDSRGLTSTSGESDPNHFEPNFRALVCKVACRLMLLPTPLEGFESLPLRKGCPHPSLLARSAGCGAPTSPSVSSEPCSRLRRCARQGEVVVAGTAPLVA
jgi:hypothetical protein